MIAHANLLSLLPLLAVQIATPIDNPGVSTKPFRLAELEAVVHGIAPQVYDVAQDDAGFLWVASSRGLGRFDGIRTEFPHAGVLDPNLPVRHVLLTSDGSIYVATGNPFLWGGPDAEDPQRGLVRIGAGSIRRFTKRDGLIDLDIRAMATSARGEVWMGTRKGLCRLSGETIACFGTDDGLPSAAITALYEDSNGILWVGTEGGLAIARNGRFERKNTGMRVTTLDGDRLGNVYALDPGGVYRVSGTTPTLVVNERLVRNMAVTRDGKLWVASLRGLLVFANGKEESATPLEALERGVLVLRSDREGNLWAGTFGRGLVQIKRKRLWNLGLDEGLSGGVALSVIGTDDGSIWATTPAGLLSRLRQGQIETHSFAPQDHYGLRGMAPSARGGVWIVASGQGMFHFDGQRYFNPTARLPRADVRAIMRDAEGDLWVSYVGEGVTRLHGENFDGPMISHTAQSGLCRAEIHSLITTPDGTRWFATERNQLAFVRGGKAGCVAIPGAPQAASTTALGVGLDGEPWFATTPGMGIMRIHNGEISQVVSATGLPASSASSITGDGKGNYWFSSEGGVWYATEKILRAAVADPLHRAYPILVYGFEDGMSSELCTSNFAPAAALDAQGRLWVPTQGGLTVFENPERLLPPVVTPTLGEIAIAGDRVTVRSPIALSAGQNVALTLSAPSLSWPRRAPLQTRLQGVDKDWIVATGPRTVYPGLDPGHYVLQMRALDFRGTVTAQRAYPIVAKRSLRPLWIGLSLILFTAGLAAAIHRIRVRRVRAHFQAIQSERERLARDLHDGISQGFTALGFQLDAMALIVPEDPRAGLEILEQARTALDRFHAQCRGAIWELRDGGTSGLPLKAALERVASDIAWAIEVHLGVPDDGPVAPPAIEREIALLVREAIANAAQHGKAQNAWISIARAGARIQLQIDDDGIGLPSEESALEARVATGHFGLKGMRERAAAWGGTLRIESRSPTGVRITIDFDPGSRARNTNA